MSLTAAEFAALALNPPKPVIIDGFLVPGLLYKIVHNAAVDTGHTQFIGVIYDQPAELKRRADEQPLDWNKTIYRDQMRQQHCRAGEHLIYVVDLTRDELLMRRDVLGILWINP